MTCSAKCSVAEGLDTTFLVEAEVEGHPGHADARRLLHDLLDSGRPLGLAQQVLAEFVHVVTDPRRFQRPLEVSEALARAETWWNAREVQPVFPSQESGALFLRWMTEHKLGRKRLLDTQLAATYLCAGIDTIVTTNSRDFQIFGCFRILTPD